MNLDRRPSDPSPSSSRIRRAASFASRAFTAIIAAFAALLSFGGAEAGRGAGELALDDGAVTAIVAAGLPSERKVQLPMGQVTLALTPPKQVRFVDGGLEGTLGVRAKEVGMSGSFQLRFVPRVENDKVMLDLVKAAPQGAAGLLPDISSLMPPVEVPNDYSWVLPTAAGGEREVRIRVGGVRVTADRLEILWELSASAETAP